MILTIGLIIIGFIFLIKGADFLVEGASSIAKKFHIPEIVIGLTIVSIGTSLPELIISTMSSINGKFDMAFGNIIGSCICNLLLILGISALIRTIKFQRETKFIELPLSLGIIIMFMIMCNTSSMITREEGIFLVLLFAIFILYAIVMAQEGEAFDNKGSEKKEENEKNNTRISITKNVIYILLGIIGLKIGGDLTVENATILARDFDISEKIISLTILSIGTSLPELMTSIIASIKGDSDIAIGNIIGSNIFNILLTIGISSVISPLLYNNTYNIQIIMLIIATVTLLIFQVIPPKNKMNKVKGLIYLGMYIIYMAVLFML